jgi:hypothetical protein
MGGGGFFGGKLKNDVTLCDQVCQWLAAGRWFTLVSSTNKTDCYEILLKVALHTITSNPDVEVHISWLWVQGSMC